MVIQIFSAQCIPAQMARPSGISLQDAGEPPNLEIIMYPCARQCFVPGEGSWIFLIDPISESVIQRKLRMPGRGRLSHLFLTDWEFCLGGHPELLPASQETRCVFHSLDCADKSIVYALESAVIQWSRQVQLVLKRESSQPLRQGESPTPKAELDFWKSRWVAG